MTTFGPLFFLGVVAAFFVSAVPDSNAASSATATLRTSLRFCSANLLNAILISSFSHVPLLLLLPVHGRHLANDAGEGLLANEQF